MDGETSSDIDRKLCSKHTREVEYFCKTHRLSVCAKCIVQDHRMCEDVYEISEDVKKTRQLLSSVRSTISGGIDKFKQGKKDAETKCENTLKEIDDLTDSLISNINKGLSKYKRQCAEQYETDVKVSIDFKLKNLEQLDLEVQSLMEKLSDCESRMDYENIESCYNTCKKFESSAKELTRANVSAYDVEFTPSDISKMILANPDILGNIASLNKSLNQTNKQSDADLRNFETQSDLNPHVPLPDLTSTVVQENKHVQTINHDEEASCDVLHNLSVTIDNIKRDGNEVVLCLGKLAQNEKDSSEKLTSRQKEDTKSEDDVVDPGDVEPEDKDEENKENGGKVDSRDEMIEDGGGGKDYLRICSSGYDFFQMQEDYRIRGIVINEKQLRSVVQCATLRAQDPV
ncbi:DNA ligase 1-like [Ruditapes philippinarum]|uniref:DNA ligase 1-like n=1 Tax=Ruditapes philippinarum TaxID=129788 RepID=UPI00295A84CD|nr:DNA ligase 1-like [Ruditapes philippinarum]